MAENVLIPFYEANPVQNILVLYILLQIVLKCQNMQITKEL